MFRRGGSKAEERVVSLLRQVDFRLTDLRYGTLIGGLDIAGWKALGELFNYSFDQLSMFLIAFVPAALALSGGPAIGQVQEVDISDAGLGTLFTAGGAAAAQGTLARAGTRQAFMQWAIANFSLLVPVVIAALLIYWHHAATSGERERLLTAWEKLAELRERANMGERDRVTRLMEAQEKTLTALASKEPVCCCVPRPTTPSSKSPPAAAKKKPCE
jgi:hypothetical protein